MRAGGKIGQDFLLVKFSSYTVYYIHGYYALHVAYLASNTHLLTFIRFFEAFGCCNAKDTAEGYHNLPHVLSSLFCIVLACPWSVLYIG